MFQLCRAVIVLLFCVSPGVLFFVVRRRGFGPRVAAGLARGSTGRGPAGAGRFPPSWRGSGCRGSAAAGRVHDDLVFSGHGLLGRGRVPEFRACFLYSRRVPFTAGDVQGAHAAAALAAAAVAWRDEVAVTWVVSMERMA